jgi:hypothetical protein
VGRRAGVGLVAFGNTTAPSLIMIIVGFVVYEAYVPVRVTLEPTAVAAVIASAVLLAAAS